MVTLHGLHPRLHHPVQFVGKEVASAPSYKLRFYSIQKNQRNKFNGKKLAGFTMSCFCESKQKTEGVKYLSGMCLLVEAKGRRCQELRVKTPNDGTESLDGHQELTYKLFYEKNVRYNV